MLVSRPLPMIFMGTETLQGGWWNADASHGFRWDLATKEDRHAVHMKALVKAANCLRLSCPELHDDHHGVDVCHTDRHNGIIAFVRRSTPDSKDGKAGQRRMGELLVVANFSPSQFENRSYSVATPWRNARVGHMFNSQAEEFGGWNESWSTVPWRPHEQEKAALQAGADGSLTLPILPKLFVGVFVRLD